ncbi:hypothetical protein RQP46_006658 [Phenoliferia psychrophenolica]
MRKPHSTWVPLLAFVALSRASATDGIAGSVNNAHQASLLQSSAHVPTQGQSYCISNVATGNSLTYTAVGNHIAPGSGPGSPFTITHYGGSTSWVRLAVGGKDKCMSSQWGGAYDHAAVMYACAVSAGGDTSKGNTLEPTKQWWLVVPVGINLNPKLASFSNEMLVEAQAISVKTREDSIKAGTSKNAFKPGNSKRDETGSSDLSDSKLERRSRKDHKSTKAKAHKPKSHKRKSHKSQKAKGSKAKATKKQTQNPKAGQKFFIIP